MYLCYGEPAPGHISKLISARLGQYHLSSSSSPVFTSPLPAALVLASLSRSCFAWRFHSQSTKFTLGIPCPVDLFVWVSHAQSTKSLPWSTHAQSTKVFLMHHSRTLAILCTNLVHHSRTLVHHSRAPLSCTTLVHHSRASLSCTITYSRAPLRILVNLSCTIVHHSYYSRALVSCSTQPLIIATINILEILIIATVYILEILIIATVK